MMLKNICVIIFISLSVFAVDEESEHQNVKSVIITQTSANVTVSTVSGTKATVKIDKSKARSDCKFNFDGKDSGNLVIDGVQSDSQSGNCQYNITVSVPTGIEVLIELGSGSIQAKGEFSELALVNNQGDANVEVKANTFEMKGKKVKLNASGSFNSGLVEVDDGDLSIKFDSMNSGTLDLRNSQGVLNLTVPSGTKLIGHIVADQGRVDYKTSSGYNLNLSSPRGEINIKNK